MRTIQISVSETDFQKYNLGGGDIKFPELVNKISLQYAKQALTDCNQIAQKVGLSKMSDEEINKEIKAMRDAKNNS